MVSRWFHYQWTVMPFGLKKCSIPISKSNGDVVPATLDQCINLCGWYPPVLKRYGIPWKVAY